MDIARQNSESHCPCSCTHHVDLQAQVVQADHQVKPDQLHFDFESSLQMRCVCNLKVWRVLNFKYDEATVERLMSTSPEQVVAELRQEASQQFLQKEVAAGK